MTIDVMNKKFLESIISYSPETGIMLWRERVFSTPKYTNIWNNRYAGHPCFVTNHSSGYNMGAIFDKKYFAHRIAWCMVYDENPKCIDHINGNKKDNRIENLRNGTFQDNSRNTKLKSNNSSGHHGIYKNQNLKWVAQITIDGVTKYIGSYDQLEDAVCAREEAEALYGFHANHGRIS